MADSAVQGGVFFGEVRHWKASEDVFVYLMDADGVGVIDQVQATNVAIVLELPDGDNHVKSGVGAPANTWTQINSTSYPGWYRMRLWGDGTGSSWNHDLAQVGVVGVFIEPVATNFQVVTGHYIVKSDFDIAGGFSYVPGAGGTDSFLGTLSFFHWHDHQILVDPYNDTEFDFSLVVRDSAGTPWVNIADKSDGAVDGANNAIFINKTISGVTGGWVLNARVTMTYGRSGDEETFVKDFQIPARFSA
jgi:hypothetical protein